jgi:branched-chain amino acid transport system substrate-binding protein
MVISVRRTTKISPTRRQVVAGGLAFGASALGMPSINKALGEEPIRLGQVMAKAGPWTGQGEYLSQGAYMALELHKNTVLGRPAEIVWLDDQSPQMAAQNAQKLIEEDKVVGIIGGSTSATALAISAVCRRAKIPFIHNNGAAREVTGSQCSPYTFRVLAPTPVQVRAMAPYLAQIGKRWYFLNVAYAFGQDVTRSFRDLLKEAGGTEVGADEVPVNTADLSSFILKIRQSRADLVCLGLAADDLSNFIKQWEEMGMKDKIPLAQPAIGDNDLWNIGAKAATGLFTKSWYYANPSLPPDEKEFAAAYFKKHNRAASDKAWQGWYAMRALIEGTELAKSTEPAKIVRGIVAWRPSDGGMFREWDHQLLRRVTVAKVKAQITDQWDYFDVLALAPKDAADIPRVFGTRDEVGCTMDAL